MFFSFYLDHVGFFAFLGGILISELDKTPADVLAGTSKMAHGVQRNDKIIPIDIEAEGGNQGDLEIYFPIMR